MFGPGWVCQPVDWLAVKRRCWRTAFVPCAWLIALVKASTERTFTGVPLASVPIPTVLGSTFREGSEA